jgi:hypothetical protein
MEAGATTGDASGVNRPGWFQKGVSGNPGGRPKRPAEVRLVERLTKQQAQAAIESLMGKAIARVQKAIGSTDESIALRAALDVLDRGLGRAVQRVDANVAVSERTQMVTPELLQEAARRLLSLQAVDAADAVEVPDADL